ncbi:MAG: type II toxin-antitoxin system prevent-host-death family antitoxin [Solirubrobacterales bacterium]
MALITARKLSRETASVIDELVTKKEPVVIVRNSQPVAVLTAVDPAHIEDTVLAASPEFTRPLARADEAAGTGETETFDEIFAEGSEADEEQRETAVPDILNLEAPSFDPVVLENLADAAIQRTSLSTHRGQADISKEQLARINRISELLAKRLLAHNISQTMQLISAVNASMVGVGQIASADDAQFEEMLDRLGEETELTMSEDA